MSIGSMPAIEYAIRSRDQSQQGVKSAEDGINRLRRGVEMFGKIMSGAIIGESTMRVVRGIVQFGSASVEAAKQAGLLTPELDKITKSTLSLKVAIGTGIAAGFKSTFAEISKGMDEISGAKVATTVATTIEKVGQSFKLLWDLVWTTGSGMFARIFVFLARAGFEGAKGLFGVFQAVFAQIGLIWENVAYAVRNVWVNVLNWIISALNKLLNLYNNSALAKITGGLGTIGAMSMDLGQKPGAVNADAIVAPFSAATEKIQGLTVEFGRDIVDSFKGIYNDVLNLFKPGANVNLPTKPGGPPGLPPPGYGNMPVFGAGAPPQPTYGTGAGSGIGSGATAGGGGLDIWGFVKSLLSGAAGTIGMVVQAIMNPLTLLIPIFNSMMSILGPLADTILAPLVGELVIVGQTIGQMLIPVFQLLAPVVDVISAGFILLYNLAIMPLANAIILTFNIIYELVATIWNAIADAINTILGWAGVSVDKMRWRSATEGFLSPISQGDLRNAGNAYLGEQAGGGNGVGASYAAAATYHITIYNTFEPGSVVDSSGTWSAFVQKVWREGVLLEAARQGA